MIVNGRSEWIRMSDDDIFMKNEIEWIKIFLSQNDSFPVINEYPTRRYLSAGKIIRSNNPFYFLIYFYLL